MSDLLRKSRSSDQLIDSTKLSEVSSGETVHQSATTQPKLLPDTSPMDHSLTSTPARTLDLCSLASSYAEPETPGLYPFPRFEDDDRQSLLGNPMPMAMNDHSKIGSLVSEPSSLKSVADNSRDRQGWSEEKCRRVLLKYCQHIPRNYHYTDGVQKVFEILREHLGDENMDLSIGVLYELIEVDTMFTWEKGAAFKRWQFEHSMRKMDLTNSHCPRLGNIVIGQIVPTSKLQDWRAMYPQRQYGLLVSSEISSSLSEPKPHYRLHGRSVWQIENTLFVTSKCGGTKVHFCPTAKELHRRAWDEEAGCGGRLIYQGPMRETMHCSTTEVTMTSSLDAQEDINSTIKGLFEKQNLENEVNSNQLLWGNAKPPNAAFARKHGLTPDILRLSISEQLLPMPLSKFAIGSGCVCQGGFEACRGSCLKPVPLSKNRAVHIGMFQNGDDIFADMPSAETLSTKRNMRALLSCQKQGINFSVSGPFTSNLFLDEYLDFDWQPREPNPSPNLPSTVRASDHDSRVPNSKKEVGSGSLDTHDEELAMPSNWGTKFNQLGAMTPQKWQREVPMDNLAFDHHSARAQRARSLSRKKLETGSDGVVHEALKKDTHLRKWKSEWCKTLFRSQE